MLMFFDFINIFCKRVNVFVFYRHKQLNVLTLTFKLWKLR